jgi:hypothetical protein
LSLLELGLVILRLAVISNREFTFQEKNTLCYELNC